MMAIKFTNGSWRSISQNKLLRNIICINTIARPRSTVDPKEIEHFSVHKDTWWDEKHGPRILHLYNSFRVQFLKDGLINAGLKIQNPDFPLEKIKIVDVGCGGGILAEALARAGARVTGIDASEQLIKVAKDHVKLNRDISEKVNYIHTTLEDFANKESKNSTYDAVIFSEVLEHVSDPQLFLKECVKIVKPGKSIFLTTINRTLTSWLSTIIVFEYIARFIPRGTHTWNKFVTPHEVQCMLKNYGCETRSIRGAKFSLTQKWSWSTSLSTFYLLHAIKQKETGM
ncbi:PREDICTED: ubiquinone biosynthesis O-methyltransferase, mitochondrial-like [Trachymyrmex septentrionalis]|uniref:ubiquinone biosynthesis O-methyltransferase, mitochondrial-like n=1 Tax=Trachymyrmex septentrionalis TaxID=34720 RepID=UPI00084F0C43|nr:PREDICTED: ubiquinone biosynthesis O-methyltransferase, mitochondrial-like [Trachymyrmex septentrionalis]